ncbi:MAG: S9 family peptidase [Elusimicrobia bacterium]|nr:S9 family peptidase [Elusimicrobiota bacterium]
MPLLPLALLALAPSFAADKPAVTFKGRPIDVKAYIEGFPYKNFNFSLETGRLFFVKKGDKETLLETSFELGKTVDLEKGKPLTDVDYAKRNLWGAVASKATGKLYTMGDEDNTEITNIYEYVPGGAFKKLTEQKYIYSLQMSPDGKKIAYSARSGPQEFTPGSIGYVDLETGKPVTLWEDSKALRTNWASIAWSPDGSKIVTSVVCDEDRTHKTLLLLSAAGGPGKTLLDCSVKRSVYPTTQWIDDGNFVFMTDETGNSVAHRFELTTGKSTPLTDPKWNLDDAVVLEGKAVRLVALERKPITNVLHVIDPSNGRILSSREYPASLAFMEGDRSALLISLNSTVVPYEIHSAALDGDELKLAKIVDYGDELEKKIVHCSAEKVSYETFDKFSAPGETQTLHAFLYSPLRPAKGDDARLLVLAFYGGVNTYSAKIHMLCNAGYYVLSPAPRGSWDWGREFHDKMQGDLGGGEILDVVLGAQAYAKQLGIPAKHVGAFGGSHGGYATLRALTLTDEVDGYKPAFRFGFGLSDYGISDLVRYVKTSNIPGWVTDMTSEDPAKNPAKWLDRSPQTHACRASGPLLLTHGSNDKRVSVEESRRMFAALKACGRTQDVYYELPEQGHGYKGTGPLVKYYQTMFGFLETLK